MTLAHGGNLKYCSNFNSKYCSNFTMENVGTAINYSSIFMRLSFGLSTIKPFFLAIDDVLEK
jgi:hypothetical protein